mmetsp:Transcript_77529/g.153956  ORF Transcript_77529/g.153956 Transcript_77529/m.153956 type:complete len:214 (+) Transcript_77529:234-875(+)
MLRGRALESWTLGTWTAWSMHIVTHSRRPDRRSTHLTACRLMRPTTAGALHKSPSSTMSTIIGLPERALLCCCAQHDASSLLAVERERTTHGLVNLVRRRLRVNLAEPPDVERIRILGAVHDVLQQTASKWDAVDGSDGVALAEIALHIGCASRYHVDDCVRLVQFQAKPSRPSVQEYEEQLLRHRRGCRLYALRVLLFGFAAKTPREPIKAH